MQLLKYSIMVLIGSISYGTLSTMMKFGFMDGHSSGELVGSQYLVGWLIVSILFLFSFKYKVSWKSAGLLLFTGMMSTFVGKAYAVSVSELPASIAVVFLFQFTWIGVIIESFINKRRPAKNKLIAIFVLFIGTLLAGAIFGQPLSELSLKGASFGMLSALLFALYMYCNSQFAVGESSMKRLFFIATGAMLTAVFTTNPVTLVTNIVQTNLWYYGLLLGILGVLVPFFFFAVSMPKVGVGLGTILCAAELPSAMVVSVIFLNEQVTSLQWFGMCLIMFGIALPEGLKHLPQFLPRRKKAMHENGVS
ncbi:EamA family transporter [Peribacillus muralis]|uniref:EamA family transporter n=1 Tax=Peribacillus muralis TaxID=264697 RepID=UPI001F4E220C|nr:DMT family transporter [Peribacillus muralis]MCK1993880.1 DMT family transporter [Peribacillus muralis]MCK2014435.1 DMT family transporter [Peribacillus muralis]